MKKLITSLVFSIFGVAFFVAPAFAATTCNVTSGIGTYPTIQSAVNDSNCNPIVVAAGTYNENVSINRSVVLNGPNAGLTGNDSSRAPEAVVTGQVNISASDVTVSGFKFTHPGIQVNINGSSTLSNVVVENNIFNGYSSVGFPTYNAGNLLVEGNLFENPQANTESMQIKASSATLGGCNGTTVSDNVFNNASNNGGADVNFSCTGSNSTNVTVSDNTDTGLSTNGTSFVAFSGVSDGIVVKDNTVTENSSNGGSAIFFFGDVSGTAEITGNTVNDTGSSAVAILGNKYTSDPVNTGTFTITQNDFSGNHRGVYVDSGALGTGAKVVVNRNNLSGDTSFGIDNEFSGLTANGTCNWWGDASGPGNVGPGTGSDVTNGVNYTPWLVSSDLLSGSCTGGVVTVTIDKYLNGVQATSALTGNASYPMVSSWNATNIGSGNGSYSLSPTGFNNSNPYEATTSLMTSGAIYSTHEVTGGTSNVLASGADCQAGKTRLVGYTTGDSLSSAASATPTTTVPSFTNITSNQYVIVWNQVCPTASGEITSPANNGDHVSGTLNLAATYNDGDVPNSDDGVQWAVRQGTCTAGTNTVLGNVDGHHDVASWNGNSFSFSADISNYNTFPGGEYCFVFNPTDDQGQPDIRLTRTFYIDVVPPTNMNQCKNDGWKVFNNPAFKNQGQCVSYVEANPHAGKQ